MSPYELRGRHIIRLNELRHRSPGADPMILILPLDSTSRNTISENRERRNRDRENVAPKHLDFR